VALDIFEHAGDGGRFDVCDDDSGRLSIEDPLAASPGPQMPGESAKSFKGILHGVTAKDLQNTGYIYAPHVPLTQTPVVFMDPSQYDEETIILKFPRPFRTLDDEWDW
jgi:hypothetical protein